MVQKKMFMLISLLMVLTVLRLPLPCGAVEKNAEFSVDAGGVTAGAGKSAEIVIKTVISKPFHLYAPGDKTGVALSYSVSSPAVESFHVTYPAPEVKDYPAMGEKLLLYEGTIFSTLEVKLAPDAPEDLKLAVKAVYQACTDTMCTPPAAETLETSLKITGSSAPAEAAPVKAVEESPSANETAATSSAGSSSFAKFYERSIFLAIAMAFLWGLISSLTPCVYPMIPITVAFFGSQTKERSKKKTFALALVFTIGMALSFAALGVIVTLVGVDMGSVMSNAWIVAFVTLLLLFFAGAMFELYEIRMPDSVMSKVGQSEQGYFGAFTMGLTMGLVAAPCVGPFAGSLLIFVSTVNSPAIGFLMLFSYGMGLGMLFLAVAMGANFLPRSGMWMVRLKNFFGLVILWLTLYFMQFVTPAYLMLAAASFYAVVTASILGVFSTVDENAPLVNHFAKGAGAVSLALAALFAVMAVLGSGVTDAAGLRSLAPAPTETVNADSKDSWIRNYDEGMKLARSGKKPVIIDFYADWCLPCKQIESEIFKNPEFIKAAERFIKIKLDCTDSSGEGASIKNRKYKSPYMPYIIFYDGAGNKTEFEIRGYASLKEVLEILGRIK